MEVLYARCCGLDVHQASINARALLHERGRVRKERRRFTTMTEDLENLAEWLGGLQVTHVAIESTGVYWKPVWNMLEGRFTIILATHSTVCFCQPVVFMMSASVAPLARGLIKMQP